MLQTGNEVRRLKYLENGQKFYRPVICFLKRSPRSLRHSTRTAAGALRYGRAVMERYQRWCDIALAKEIALSTENRHAN